jgi:hypothetical protein
MRCGAAGKIECVSFTKSQMVMAILSGEGRSTALGMFLSQKNIRRSCSQLTFLGIFVRPAGRVCKVDGGLGRLAFLTASKEAQAPGVPLLSNARCVWPNS